MTKQIKGQVMAKSGTGGRVAVCTIVSKNYLHYARTLMDSLRAAHPDWRRVVLLVDELDGSFDPAGENYEILEVSRLPLPDPKKFFFRYTILELNTAVKPWFLEWLFQVEGMDQVIYLDPDIYVYRPFTEVQAALDDGALMVLTPHLTGELADNRRPNEHDILKAGCFNLGFIALARHRRLENFLHWWQRKLEFDCRIDFPQGLFVDQKWIDLAPGMFEDVHVLRHEGYNVAYWNLAHRKVEKREDGFWVNGRPLVFFHFSGVNPRAPESFSKHQDRFRLHELGAGTDLVTGYCQRVLGNGHETCRRWRYAYDHFADGSRVLDLIRLCYRRDPQAQERAGDDPFTSEHTYFNEPWGKGTPLITNLMRALWELRYDLHVGFPDLDGADRRNFVAHFLTVFAPAEGIPERFLAPAAASYEELLLADALPVASPVPEPPPPPPRSPLLRRVARKGLRTAKACARPVFRRVLSQGQRHRLKVFLKRLLLGTEPPPAPPAPAPAATAAETNILSFPGRAAPPRAFKPGLNITGYARSEHGLGEVTRRCAQAADAVALPFSVHDFNVGNNSRTTDDSWAHRMAATNDHWVNLFCINADQMPVAREALGQAFFAGHYNIGLWHWELPEFPDMWLPSFELLDEVWAPTRFVQEAVSRKSPLPVVRMPHAIHFEVDPGVGRTDLGLPEGQFLFLTMYDTHSFQIRKNPRAVIAAFRKAFPRPGDVALVLKINNPKSYPEEVEALKAELAGVPGIVIMDRILSRQDVYNLESLCDCFVSLHRSEGFGLGLAESMFAGRPVIGTNWSANIDFMDQDNSCPVNYRLIELEEDYGPYQKGQVWADPDVDHAAWYMKRLVEDGAYCRDVGARGQHTIRTDFSPQAVGRLYQRRLRRLAQLHGRGEPGGLRAAA